MLYNSPQSELLFLIGYRGTGKSTVARLVAKELGWAWLDADNVLEARYATTIRRIFETEGETSFRLRETAVLEDLCQLRQHVVATGGGVVLSERNRQRLRSAGRVIGLTAASATLWQRLQADAATAERRPKLTVGGQTEIETLLRIREPLYRACAEYMIDTEGRTAEEVAAAILQYLNLG